MTTEMTALEMAQKFAWAEVTVMLNFGSGYAGHFTVSGRTKVVDGGGKGNAVWVDKLALDFNTIVTVNPVGSEGAVVSIHPNYQNQKLVA